MEEAFDDTRAGLSFIFYFAGVFPGLFSDPSALPPASEKHTPEAGRLCGVCHALGHCHLRKRHHKPGGSAGTVSFLYLCLLPGHDPGKAVRDPDVLSCPDRRQLSDAGHQRQDLLFRYPDQLRHNTMDQRASVVQHGGAHLRAVPPTAVLDRRTAVSAEIPVKDHPAPEHADVDAGRHADVGFLCSHLHHTLLHAKRYGHRISHLCRFDFFQLRMYVSGFLYL